MPSPDTIKNKLSVVRRYIQLSSGDMEGINSIWVKNAIDAICRVKYFSKKVKNPISVKNLRKIILSQPDTFIGNSIRAILLIMYYGAFRQSEVVPVTISSFDKDKNICKKDVSFKNGNIIVDIRWAKNCQKFDQKREVCIPPLSDKRLCPVKNLKAVLRASQNKKPDDPLFVFKDKAPISVNYLRTQWKKSLKALNMSEEYTLHSIRRSAATYAYKEGCTPLQVQRYGGWSSQAHLSYIKTDAQEHVTKALGRAMLK